VSILGQAITVIILAANLLGDALRELLRPQVETHAAVKAFRAARCCTGQGLPALVLQTRLGTETLSLRLFSGSANCLRPTSLRGRLGEEALLESADGLPQALVPRGQRVSCSMTRPRRTAQAQRR